MTAVTPDPTMPDSAIAKTGEPSASSELTIRSRIVKNSDDFLKPSPEVTISAALVNNDEQCRYPSSKPAMRPETAAALGRLAELAAKQLRAML